MGTALVDTTVLYAAGNRRAAQHELAHEIVRRADEGELPSLRVPGVVLTETMNGLRRDVGHDTAVGILKRLQEGKYVDFELEPPAVWKRGFATFEKVERLSFADAVPITSTRHHGIEYVYTFDDDFDGIDGIGRLATPDNPFAP
ncbi:VapC toxin family PIN domain ribonuclease [Halobacteriales archaeon QS_1_68_20]|nr:MAG: VapC toxin family PIN domain ribonuclease [Halobacteriales archaeon QS_1_68_20]